MLTEEQIEDILYQYTKRQDEFNMFVIKIITDRLSNLADFDNLYTLSSSYLVVEDLHKIKRRFVEYVKEQEKHLEEDFWQIAFTIYAESLQFYDYPVKLKDNKELADLVSELTRLAKIDFTNLTKNPVFVIRDLQNPNILKPYSLEQTYRSVLNEALNYRDVNNELRDIALKRTETQLFDSGIRFIDNLSSDNAKDATSANRSIRFNVLENLKNLINKMQDIMGKQFGADGLELSAHIFPAPDHAPAQGHQFTFKEIEKMQRGENFTDVNGVTYIGFERQIGTWNCRHYFMQIKLGTEPTYTQKQLDKILEDNEKGYTDANGKHRTLYECTQVQRRYEREIRKAKEKYLMAKSLKDKNAMSQARNRVGILTTQYKQFSLACDIPAKLERIRVKDYI